MRGVAGVSKECPVVDIGRMTNSPKAGSLGEGGEGLGQGRGEC